MRRTLLVLCLLGTSMAAISCERIPEIPETVTIERIPAEYGELVNVTPFGPKPHQAVLWFEKPDHEIVAMRVNLSTGEILEKQLTFPRQ